jgi:hypothetical protein
MSQVLAWRSPFNGKARKIAREFRGQRRSIWRSADRQSDQRQTLRSSLAFPSLRRSSRPPTEMFLRKKRENNQIRVFPGAERWAVKRESIIRAEKGMGKGGRVDDRCSRFSIVGPKRCIHRSPDGSCAKLFEKPSPRLENDGAQIRQYCRC